MKQVFKIVGGGYRDSKVDIIRGLAIIIVVLEHSIGIASNPVAKVFLSFHMPLFFFISGCLVKEENQYSFIKCVRRKARALLIPQITIGLLLWLYNYTVSYNLLHTAEPSDLNPLLCIIHYWFLLVMFYVVILWDTLVIRIGLKGPMRLALLAACFMALLFIPPGYEGPLFIAVTPIALGFYIACNIVKDYMRIFEKRGVLWCIILLTCLLTSSQFNEPVLMYDNVYGNKVLFLVGAISGIIILYIVASRIRNNDFLEWCGINSIYLYVLHFTVVQGVRGILVRLIGMENELVRGFAVFVIAFPITVVLSAACKRYVPFLFGKVVPPHLT